MREVNERSNYKCKANEGLMEQQKIVFNLATRTYMNTIHNIHTYLFPIVNQF